MKNLNLLVCKKSFFYTITILSAVMLVSFQNCGKVKFDTNRKADLIPQSCGTITMNPSNGLSSDTQISFTVTHPNEVTISDVEWSITKGGNPTPVYTSRSNPLIHSFDGVNEGMGSYLATAVFTSNGNSCELEQSFQIVSGDLCVDPSGISGPAVGFVGEETSPFSVDAEDCYVGSAVWDMNTDGTPEYNNNVTDAVTYTYNAPGTYTVTVRTTNTEDSSQVTLTRQIVISYANCTNGATNPPLCDVCSAGNILVGGQCVNNCTNGATNPPTCSTCPTGRTLVGGQCVNNCTNGATNPPTCTTCPSGQILVGNQCTSAYVDLHFSASATANTGATLPTTDLAQVRIDQVSYSYYKIPAGHRSIEFCSRANGGATNCTVSTISQVSGNTFQLSNTSSPCFSGGPVQSVRVHTDATYEIFRNTNCAGGIGAVGDTWTWTGKVGTKSNAFTYTVIAAPPQTCPNNATNPPVCDQCSSGQILVGNQCITPVGCTLDGVTVPHGQSRNFFNSASVACGQSCSSISRTCNNGVLSGNAAYNRATCAVASCTQSCTTPWGSTVAHGAQATAYNPSGVCCRSETQTCNNGVLRFSMGFNTNNCGVIPTCPAQASCGPANGKTFASRQALRDAGLCGFGSKEDILSINNQFTCSGGTCTWQCVLEVGNGSAPAQCSGTIAPTYTGTWVTTQPPPCPTGCGLPASVQRGTVTCSGGNCNPATEPNVPTRNCAATPACPPAPDCDLYLYAGPTIGTTNPNDYEIYDCSNTANSPLCVGVQSKPLCNGVVPPTGQSQCRVGACTAPVTYSWDQGAFGACSATACGTSGTQTRSVVCRNNEGTQVANSFCTSPRPATSQACSAEACAAATCGSENSSGPCEVAYYCNNTLRTTRYGETIPSIINPSGVERPVGYRIHINSFTNTGYTNIQNDYPYICNAQGNWEYNPTGGNAYCKLRKDNDPAVCGTTSPTPPVTGSCPELCPQYEQGGLCSSIPVQGGCRVHCSGSGPITYRCP